MKMATFGPVDCSEDASGKAVAEALEALGAIPKLAIVYLPIDTNHAAHLQSICRIVDAPLVGATTGGSGFTERGCTRDGAVGALLGGDDVDVQISTVKLSEKLDDIDKAVKGFAGTSGAHTVIALADAFACDGELLLAALRRAAPVHWRFIGGTAGDNWKFSGTKVFQGTEVLSGAVVLAHLCTRAPMSIGVNHGWCAVRESRKFIITSIDGNILRQLDNRPAAEVYTEELVRLGLMNENDDPVKKLATYELGASTPFGEGLKIRAPLALGDDGSITMASSLSKGEILRVVQATPGDLISAAEKLHETTVEPLRAGGVRGQLVFDCAARLQLLGERYPDEVAAFHGPGSHPMLGFACYGEIAKFGGSLEGFHNTTAVMSAW